MLRAKRGSDTSPGQPTSAVRQVLLAMHQEQASGTPPTHGVEKLKSSISKLQRDAKDPATDSEAKVVQDYLLAQLKAVHRTLPVLSASVEEEVGALRAANKKLWEQLKLQGSLFSSEGEANKRELEKLRAELRSTRNQLSVLQNNDHAPLATTVGELQAEVADLKEQLAACRKAQEELSSLRRWRGEVEPQIDAASRAVTQLRRVEGELPQLRQAIEDRTRAAAEEAARQQSAAEEVEATRSQLARLGEQQRALGEELHRSLADSRGAAEATALRVRQLSAEAEHQAEKTRTLVAETSVQRQAWREEATELSEAVRAVQSAASRAAESADRATASLGGEVREARRAIDVAAGREAQTTEVVLALRQGHGQASAWLEHLQARAPPALALAPPSSALARSSRPSRVVVWGA